MMPMPSTLSRIFGWEPPADEVYVEVEVPGLPTHRQLPPFQPFDRAPSSPASSTSALSDDQSERRPEGNGKKGDPNWIARPRNEFILFRCDYVRKHTKEGGNKRTRRAPGQEAEKTLSKLAAEAWRALPSEERVYWREQANLERNDHARKYPDYRYRPKKSATARKRQSRSSMSSSVVTRSMPAPAIVDRVTVDTHSRSPSYEPMPVVDRPGLFLDNSTLRKSTSVPALPSTHGRRGEWVPLSLQSINSFDSRSHPSGINSYHQALQPSGLQHSQSYDSLNLATPALSESMSLADSASSSLINWNADSHILAPQPTQYIDALSLPVHSNFGDADSMDMNSKYLAAVSGGHPSGFRAPGHGHLPHPQALDGPHWAPDIYHPTGAINMVRPPSGDDHPPSLGPTCGGGSVMYDQMGRIMQHEDFQGQGPIAVTVVPGEYLANSAELTPDEVFVMDREEYFTQY
ncbi:hypothetical protein D9611_004141 [Ephemerocybe angulata]|uniref:HMG box domain-containing protein n=1 Tax=Ephemerocybe angulata TaxID=980116 RepID=A0A8H5F5M8_9AGAR|nr:hypothetical protein D9611_004141 [Tulosesus angulatus]